MLLRLLQNIALVETCIYSKFLLRRAIVQNVGPWYLTWKTEKAISHYQSFNVAYLLLLHLTWQVHKYMQKCKSLEQGMAKVILAGVGLDSATRNRYKVSTFWIRNPTVSQNIKAHKKTIRKVFELYISGYFNHPQLKMACIDL